MTKTDEAAQPHPPPEGLVPLWLQRSGAIGWRVLVTIGLVVVIAWLVVSISTVSAAIAISAIVCATVAPLLTRLRREGRNRTRAAAVASLVAALIILAVSGVLLVAIVPTSLELVAAIQAGGEQVREALASIGVAAELAAVVGGFIDSIRGGISDLVAGVVGSAAAAVTALILATFLTFYLLADYDKAWAWLVAPIRGWRADAVTESATVGLQRVGSYNRGTAVLAVIDGAVVLLLALVFALPLPGALTALTLIGGFVPYLGPIVTTSIVVLVALGSVGATAASIILGLVIAVHVIEGIFLTPRLYPRSARVHPALVVVALPAGASLFGILGLIAAVPVVAIVRAVVPALVTALGTEPATVTGRERLVPVWLDRLGQWSWRLLIVFGLGAVATLAAIRIPGVVLPLVLAVVLAATLRPAMFALVRRGLSRPLAAIVPTVGLAVVIAVASAVSIVAMGNSFGDIFATAQAGSSADAVASLGLDGAIHELLTGLDLNIAALFASVFGLSIVLVVSGLLTFFLMRDGDDAWTWFLGHVSGGRRPLIAQAGHQTVDVLGGYMIGTAVVSLFGAVSTAVIMAILGLPLVVPIAVLAFFLGFIPYIGGFIATGLAFLVAIAVGTTVDIVIMAIFTIVFNIAQGNFVAPLVYGKAVSLHPAVVLLAVPAGGQVAGIMGMFLVVPVAGIVAVTWRLLLAAIPPTPEAPAALGIGTGPPESSEDPAPTPLAEGAAPSPAPGPAG